MADWCLTSRLQDAGNVCTFNLSALLGSVCLPFVTVTSCRCGGSIAHP